MLSSLFRQGGNLVLKNAYMAGWRNFVSQALTKFSPFVDDSDSISDVAKEMWLFVVNETDDKFVDKVSLILDKYIDRISLLMSVMDDNGRKAIDLATEKYKQAMLERSFLFRRYEIRNKRAEHLSETCAVYLAKDHKDCGRRVALKFIYNRDHFEREKNARINCHFDNEYIISTLQLYDGGDEKDKEYGDEAVKKGYSRYCLVMPAAERNLGTVIVHEHVAGRDWDMLRLISKQLVEALGHVHENGYIHGDVKRKIFDCSHLPFNLREHNFNL